MLAAARIGQSAGIGMHGKRGGACYFVSEQIALQAGGHGNGYTWPEVRGYHGASMNVLREAVTSGRLKPGMVVWANLYPGTDPASLHPSNLNHWMIYLGKDSQGTPRFADNYRPAGELGPFSLDELIRQYGNRRIDRIYDPMA